MPRYIVTQLSYIGGRLVEPGEEVEYDGKPGSALEPVDAPAKGRGRKTAATPEANESPSPSGDGEGGTAEGGDEFA
jgi:hypothetical protein